MWKYTGNNVNKSEGKRMKGAFLTKLTHSVISFPQVNFLEILKTLGLEPLKNYSHIHTPNSSNRFYI